MNICNDYPPADDIQREVIPMTDDQRLLRLADDM
jgi:hypothetical protein